MLKSWQKAAFRSLPSAATMCEIAAILGPRLIKLGGVHAVAVDGELWYGIIAEREWLESLLRDNVEGDAPIVYAVGNGQAPSKALTGKTIIAWSNDVEFALLANITYLAHLKVPVPPYLAVSHSSVRGQAYFLAPDASDREAQEIAGYRPDKVRIQHEARTTM